MQYNVLLSVIIVSYNSGLAIRNAIESVIAQKYTELIIIDGDSTDNTKEIISQYNEKIAFWSSEPDTGIYDAMNKGLLHVSGMWVYFLGSDDVLVPEIVRTIKPILDMTGYDLVYGSIRYDVGKIFQSKFSLKTLLHNTIHHQSAFYRRELFYTYRFDSSLKIIADYELNLIIYLRSKPAKGFTEIVANCTYGGSSQNIKLSLEETNKIRGKHISPFLNYCLSQILRTKFFLKYVLLR